MTNMQETSADYEYKSLTGQFNIDEALGIVECFAAGVGNKDSVGDICLPGCFTNSLKRRKPRVVWGHNWNEPIGKVLEIYEVGPNDPRLPAKMRKAGVGGLYTRVQFNLKAERGREAFANVSFFGLEQEWSIGYKTLDAVFDPTQQANLLKEVELYEVSPVLHGANQLTGTISIKSDEQGGEVKGGPCWDGYRQEGMKKGKNGNMVPNCVPIEEKGAKLRDPNGGLTAAGRAHFKRTEGANLKPGVKGPADTPEKMRRKGSFLTRFFTNPSGPMKKPNGEPTRLALSASAWGEPVPKNAADAAELAAKGRRLLERYSNTKKKDDSNASETKNHVTAIYEAMNNGENSVVGRAADLTRALASHFGGAVRLVNADNDIAIFEMGAGVSVETLRVSYYFDGDEFMFGTSQQVRPETVYIPTNNSNGSRIGDDGTPNAMIISMGQTNGSLYDAMSSAAVPHEACCDDCSKGDTSCSIPNNLSTLEEFKSANSGEHLFLLPENNAEKIEAFEIINTIAEYHSFDVKVLENGIVVPDIDKVSVAAYKALSNVFDSFEQKALGAAIGKKPRNTNAFTARNADNDPYVLEGITTINRGRGVIDPTPGSDLNVPKKPKRTRRPGEADMPSVPEPVTIPEEIPEVQPVKPDVKPARPVIVPEKEPDKVPETVPEKEPERVPERVPQREPERVPERVPRRQPERTPLPVEVPERVPQRVSGGPAGRMSGGRRFSQEQRPIDMDTAEKVFNAFNAVSKNKDTKKAYEQVARKFNISPRTVERYVNEIGKRSNRDLPYVKRPEEAGVVDVDSPRGAMASQFPPRNPPPRRPKPKKKKPRYGGEQGGKPFVIRGTQRSFAEDDAPSDFVIPGRPGVTREQFERETEGLVPARNRDFKKAKKKIKKKLKNGDDSPIGTMSSLSSDSNFSAREKRQMREEKLGRQIFLARDNDGISLAEAASQFSITREKARQLELRHMSKLRGMDENSPNRITRRMLDDPSSILSDEETSLMKRRLDGETLEEAAERLDTDRQTVRRKEQIAMRKLRDSMVIENGPVGSMSSAKWTESIRAAESVDDLKGRDSSPRTNRFSSIFYSAPVGRMSGDDSIEYFDPFDGDYVPSGDDPFDDEFKISDEDDVTKPSVERPRTPLLKPDATPVAPGKPKLRGDGITWDSKPATSGRPRIEVTPPVITPPTPGTSKLRGTGVTPTERPRTPLLKPDAETTALGSSRLRGTGVTPTGRPIIEVTPPVIEPVAPGSSRLRGAGVTPTERPRTPLLKPDVEDATPAMDTVPRYTKGSEEAINAAADALHDAFMGRESEDDTDLLDSLLESADDIREVAPILRKKMKDEITGLNDESLLSLAPRADEGTQGLKDEVYALLDKKRVAKYERNIEEVQKIQEEIDFAVSLVNIAENSLEDIREEIAKRGLGSGPVGKMSSYERALPDGFTSEVFDSTGRKKSYLKQNNPDDPELDNYLPNIINSFLSNFSITGEPYFGNNSPDGPSGAIRAIDRIISDKNNEESSYPERLMRNVYSSFGNLPIEQIAKDNDISRSDVVQIVKAQAIILSATETPERSEMRYLMREHGYLLQGTDRDILTQKLYGATNLDIAKEFNLRVDDIDSRLTKSMRTLRKADGSTSKPFSVSGTRYGIDDDGFFIEADTSNGSIYKKYIGKTQLDSEIDDYLSDGPVGSMAIRQNKKTRIYANGDDGQVEEYDLTDDLSDGVSMQEKPYLRRVRGFNQPELHEILGRKLLAEDGGNNYMVVETPEYSFVTNDEAQAMARAAERGMFLDNDMKPQGLFLNPDGTETLRAVDISMSPREGSRIVSWNDKAGYDGEPSYFKLGGEIFATADMSESWDEEEREARRLIRNKKVRRLESGPDEKFWTQDSWKWRYQGTSPDLIVTKDADTPDFGPAVIEKIHTLRNSEQSAALREAVDSKDKKDLTGAERNYSVLGDMYYQYAKNGKLSDRQWSYAAAMIDKFESSEKGYSLAPGEEAVLRVNRETGELLSADPEDGKRLVNAARTLEQDDADIEKLLYRYDIDGGLMPEQWDRMRTLTRQRMAESRAARQAGQATPSQAAQSFGTRGTNIDKSEIGDDGKLSSTYVNKITGEVTKYNHKNVGSNSNGPVFLVTEDENGNLVKWNHPVAGDLFSYSDWPQEELGEIFDETVEKIRTQRGRHPATDGVMISAKPWDVEADIRGKAGENVTAQELKEEYEKLGLYGLGLNSSTPVIETDSEIILAKGFTESDIKKAVTDARDSGLKISFEYLKPDADRPEKRTVTEPRYEERFGGDGKVISAYIVGIDEKDGKEKNFRTDRMYGRKSEKPKPDTETGERTETRRPDRDSQGASRPRDNSTRRPRDEGSGERKPREEESGQRERTQPREEQERPRERQTERQRTTADVVARTISLRRGARERTLLISLDDNQGTVASTLATADRDVIDAEFPYGNRIYAVELVKFVKNTNGDVSLHATDKSDGQRKIFDPYMIAIRSTSEPIPTSLPYLLEDLSRKIGVDRRGFAIASASDIAAYNRAKEKLARASRKNQINSFDTGPFGALGLNASRVPNYSPTDFWRPNKHDSTYSSMPESQRMAESKRLLSRITNSSNRNDSQLNDVLDRYAALERINKTANGPYIDEFGASITRLKNNEYEISGNIPFDPEMNSSPFGKMGRYVRPRNAEERNIDNLYNIQIYNELTELISSVPEGQAISQLAQRHSTSQQNIKRRLNVVDRERANEISSFDAIDEITSQLESGEIDYNELEMRLDDEMSQRELVKNIDYAYREMNFSYDDSGPVGAMSGKNASEMSDDELVDAWNDAMEKLFGSYGRPHRKDRAAKSALMKELKSVGREIQKRYFDSEDAKSAIREIQQNPPQGPVGSMSSGSMPDVPISGSRHVDRRLYEVYGDDKWKIVAEQIGKRFSTIEQRDWENPTDDDLIDIHHYLNQRIFDSQISGEDLGDIDGMPYDILSVAGDLDISANQVVDYAQKGREIAEARMASLMTPFERAERMIVNDRRKTFERLLSRKRKELGDGFDDWFQAATERNKNTLYDENGNERPIEQIEDLGGPYAGYFSDGENTTEPDADTDTAREIEELNKLFNSPTYNPEEGGSGPVGSMGRRFVPQRYDIKPTEDGKWVIIDTANRNAPVSRSFDSRLEALDGAKRMDRNDTTFNPFSPARISSQNPPQRQEPTQNPVIESGIYENEQPELPFSDGPAGGMRRIPGSRYSSNDPVRRNGARVTKGNAEAAIDAYEDGDAMLPYGGGEDATEYVLFSGWTAADSALDTIIGRLEYLSKMRTHAGSERDKKKAEVRKLVSYLPKLQKRRKWFYLQLRRQMLEKRDVEGVLQFDEMDRLRSGASLEDQTILNSSNLPRYNIPGITVPRVETPFSVSDNRYEDRFERGDGPTGKMAGRGGKTQFVEPRPNIPKKELTADDVKVIKYPDSDVPALKLKPIEEVISIIHPDNPNKSKNPDLQNDDYSFVDYLKGVQHPTELQIKEINKFIAGEKKNNKRLTTNWKLTASDGSELDYGQQLPDDIDSFDVKTSDGVFLFRVKKLKNLDSFNERHVVMDMKFTRQETPETLFQEVFKQITEEFPGDSDIDMLDNSMSLILNQYKFYPPYPYQNQAKLIALRAGYDPESKFERDNFSGVELEFGLSKEANFVKSNIQRYQQAVKLNSDFTFEFYEHLSDLREKMGLSREDLQVNMNVINSSNNNIIRQRNELHGPNARNPYSIDSYSFNYTGHESFLTPHEMMHVAGGQGFDRHGDHTANRMSKFIFPNHWHIMFNHVTRAQNFTGTLDRIPMWIKIPETMMNMPGGNYGD